MVRGSYSIAPHDELADWITDNRHTPHRLDTIQYHDCANSCVLKSLQYNKLLCR